MVCCFCLKILICCSYRFHFFLCQLDLASPLLDPLGINAILLAPVHAGHDKTGVVAVEDSQGKTQVPSAVIKRVEADDADFLHGKPEQVLEFGERLFVNFLRTLEPLDLSYEGSDGIFQAGSIAPRKEGFAEAVKACNLPPFIEGECQGNHRNNGGYNENQLG